LKEKIAWIKSTQLSIDPLTKRDTYDTEIFQRLVEDMRENGFKEEHPLVIRADPKKKGQYYITCGQHRFEAGLKAGIGTFPCIKRLRQIDPIIALREAYQDNLLRCEPDPITEAEYFEKIGLVMLKQMGYTKKKLATLKRKMPVERIAAEVGLSLSIVKKRLSLLRLPKITRFMISRFSMKNARGFKIPVSTGEELVPLYEMLKTKKNQWKIDPDRELNRVAFKCYKEKMRVKEVRNMVAEIARQGYDNWKNKKVVIDEKGVICAICGERAAHDDSPWIPLCNEHKADILTNYKTHEFDKELKNVIKKHGRQLKPNPHLKPLHESDPQIHKLKRRSR
jgi:ParB/RepB/Spo0J family partition protein